MLRGKLPLEMKKIMSRPNFVSEKNGMVFVVSNFHSHSFKRAPKGCLPELSTIEFIYIPFGRCERPFNQQLTLRTISIDRIKFTRIEPSSVNISCAALHVDCFRIHSFAICFVLFADAIVY